jgi:hypothetical protein
MPTRTRTTTAPATPAPATAKKTAAKKTRAPRKTTAKKAPTPRLSLGKTDTPPAKKTPAKKTAATRAAAKKTATAWPEFITHKMITAHYQARLHGLPTRNIRDWHENRGIATLTFPAGARIDHTPTADAPFHAHTPCKNGGIHYDPIHSPQDLHTAEQAAAACTDRHGAPAALTLGAGLKRAKDITADTQSMSLDEIGDHIAQQIADQDKPKEHPEP